MGKKKEFKRLKKKVKNLERGFNKHKSSTEKHFNTLETLLSDFNEKITAVLTIRQKSENGVHEKKLVKKK